MLPRLIAACAVLCALRLFAAPFSTNGNRLAYLDSDDPFYPGLHFPKLVTPQWVGEEGVDAVVILAIDDMRNNEPKYEAMLRPILERLKKIDGRAPVSIMVNTTSPTNAQLQSWLKEGVSLECHTIAHPCPLCQKGDFNFAFTNFHECVDLLNTIPGNKPVAFRMPCCDSMNSPTPRFYAEIFNRTSAKGNFLSIDSSVMVILTTNDTSLPRELVIDEQGRERFRKYLPSETNATTRVSMGSFTTTIEDYPYPYVINKTCWEFPCIVPSDWEASNLHGATNVATVRDWKRALDAIVLKQGVMTFIFHPHGWIKPEQMVEFIDYAASKYGKRVKFLNFKEAQERLNQNLLSGPTLQSATATDQGVRLADLNNDGFLDVMIGRQAPPGSVLKTRLWNDTAGHWDEGALPFTFAVQSPVGGFVSIGIEIGVLDQQPIALNAALRQASQFRDGKWEAAQHLTNGLDFEELRLTANRIAVGVRFHEMNHDGNVELFIAKPEVNKAFEWSMGEARWKPLPFALPDGTSLVDDKGRDAGLRFVDVDGDGCDDVIFSNHERYSLHLFRKDDRKLRLKPGWSDEIISGNRVNALTDPIPPIVRDGTNRNNGAWFARDTMWIQNEDTTHLPDKVDRRTFKQLLSSAQPRATSPEESLKAMRVRPGFKVELVASEPLIQSPVAFEWSADGKLWVVEMGDYPLGLDGKGKGGGGRIRVLEDIDGDGRYDHATTFLEGLNFPNGIYPWRNGVVISAAPEIFFAADTNGDGRADVREVLFTGFTEGNQQHRVNGFDFGLDGWLYAANGDSGGNVRGKSGSPLSLRGHDLRILPDRQMVETVEGQTQFGRHRDDFGNWFGNNNPTWLWHYFFPEHYLARNPFLSVKVTKKILANYPESTRCFPVGQTLSRFNDAFAAGHVTSGCSVTPYRDELFGSEFATSVFVCEPVHNLVHREVLQSDGVTFASQRAPDETNSEFMGSSDNCFRPVFARTGPDGALHVADMYRSVIEHPEWIPAEMQKRLDLRLGADRGRIYRVSPASAPARRTPNFALLATDALVAALDSPNGWQRDTVQRLLLERTDKTVAAKLEEIARNAKSKKVRVQALWTLGGLDALSERVLLTALGDESAEVREHAVKLSEGPALRGSLVGGVLALASDPNARVRFQVAFTLGECSDVRAAKALDALTRDRDENVRNAALSSAPRHANPMLAMANASPPRDARVLPMLRKLAENPRISVPEVTVLVRTNIDVAAQRAARAKALERFSDVPRISGDAQKGAALFQQHCAQCHRLRGAGAEVGPDLGIMTGKSVEQVVEAVIDPNAAVDARYQAFTIVTKSEDEMTGIAVADTPTSITLRSPNSEDRIFLRTDIKELSTAGQSLMPENFEIAFTSRDLADLTAFILGR